MYALALQPDGKVLIGHQYGYARLNSNGSMDTNFIATIDYDYGGTYSITVQSDGKVLVGGYVGGVGIARLNANGSPDTSFNVWPEIYGIYGASVFSVTLQSDGKVLVGGQWNTSGGTNNGIVRLNANGSLDNSFNPGAGVSGYVYSVAVQSDGKVLIGGDFISVNGTNRNRIARLNSNGSLDSSFNPVTGIGFHPYGVRSVVVQSDGKVLIGGSFTVDGTNQNGIARLNANGSLDSSFDPGTGAYGVFSVALQSNGKVLIGGGFTTVNGTNRNRMARLNTDGSLDDSFHSGRGVLYWAGSLTVQPDGKVLVGGVRLNADGSLDSTYIQPTNNNTDPFPADISFPGSDYVIVTCGAVQSDGKRLFGGYFASTYVDPEGGVNRWTQYFLLRFNADATRDTNFAQIIGGPDYGMSDTFLPMTLVVQPDGKLLFAARYGFTRLNANGTPDTNFVAAVGPVSSIRLQPDGRIFITGGFAFVNGTNRGGIAQLNPDGSLDNSFNPGTAAGGSVVLITPASHNLPETSAGTMPRAQIKDAHALQSDGKVLIGGNFTTVNGTNRNNIARLNPNGSLDSSFNPSTGADGVVRSIALQSDGNVLIGRRLPHGQWSGASACCPPLRRFRRAPQSPQLNLQRVAGNQIVLSWPTNATGFRLQSITNLTDNWTSASGTPTIIGSQFYQTNAASNSRMFYRLIFP